VSFSFLITTHNGKTFEKTIKAQCEHNARRALMTECLKRSIFIKSITSSEEAK